MYLPPQGSLLLSAVLRARVKGKFFSFIVFWGGGRRRSSGIFPLDECSSEWKNVEGEGRDKRDGLGALLLLLNQTKCK